MIRELDYGGTERQLTEIAKGLDRSRFTPHVGCFLPEGICGRELRELEIPIAVFPVRSLASPSTLQAARDMFRYVKRHDVQLVHTFDVPATIFGIFAARACGVPVVLASQRAHRGLTPGVYRRLLRLSDRVADGTVVNCEAMRRHLIEDEKVAASRIHLCYNSVDTGVFRSGRAWMPQELEGASLVIGVASAQRPEKGLGTLVEAFARVRHLEPGMRLLMLGDGPCHDELRAQAMRLGIESSCVFLPPMSDIERWLPLFDIFVMPSLSEALSNSVMEAMASGCCVVASDVGGNPELVLDGRTGLLFAAGDAAGLAERLQRLIQDPLLRKRLADESTRWMNEKFSRAASLSRMQQIYESYLGEPAGGK
jgi:glycosyltransferase involved in cell wall biosynthesis